MARLAGCDPAETGLMNGLTVNLHLMLASFYRPTARRYRIVVEADAFPSDLYAVDSHIAWHGLDPADAVVRLRPREGETMLRTEDVADLFTREGDRVAVCLLGGVNYRTGQALDMASVTAAARACGCVVGWDLAHAIGNVPLALHDWGVDFAVWCTYKYLNGGPGAVAGYFVHERHGQAGGPPRLAGWWGNDPSSRFAVAPGFQPAGDVTVQLPQPAEPANDGGGAGDVGADVADIAELHDGRATQLGLAVRGVERCRLVVGGGDVQAHRHPRGP
jgi:kynureninase